MEQTFFQASACAHALADAFSVALDAYVDSGLILTIQEAITTILSGRALPFGERVNWRRTNLLDKETAEKIGTLLKENRLRRLSLAFFRKAY